MKLRVIPPTYPDMSTTTAIVAGGEPAALHPACVGGSNGVVPAHPLPLPPLNWDNYSTYIVQVQQTFKDVKPKFYRFKKIMWECFVRGIDASKAVLKVTEAFKGHRLLLYGFNSFIPKGFSITSPDHYDQALHYLCGVQKRFARQGHVYEEFLKILSKDRNEGTAIPEVYEEVVHLFTEHPDLVARFHYFLPDSNGPVSSSKSVTSPVSSFQKRLDSLQEAL